MIVKSGPQKTINPSPKPHRKESTPFLKRLKRRIYARDTYFGLEKDPADASFYPPPKFNFDLQLASEKHILEALYRAQYENKQFLYDLIQRKWAYEPGFHRCYVALTQDTHDLCCMQWVILPQANNSPDRTPETRFVHLNEGECMLENAFTFEKYQNDNIMPTVLLKLCGTANSAGYKRVITYVRQDDASFLKDCHKVGFKDFEKRIEVNFLFIKQVKKLKIKQPQNPVNILFAAPSSRA